MKRMSAGWWMRTVFLGLPVLWLVVVTLMLVNMSLDHTSQTSGDLYQQNDHRHGFQRPEKVDGSAKVRVDDQLQRNAPGDTKFVRQMTRSKDSFIKVKKPTGNPSAKDIVRNKEKEHYVISKSAELRRDSNLKLDAAGTVVDINDLMYIPEIKRLARILKPAGNRGAAGEYGRGVDIQLGSLSPEERAQYDHGWKVNSFNQLASDRISVHRTLPDNREKECSNIEYPELPDTSVIICFHNEAMSVLLRTVHSVINRTPAKLLAEIILVDDFSDQDHLKAPLEAYVARLSKVRLVRTNKREGLVRARLLGYSVAKGTVLTFLDSHCECSEGWLEPLLGPIAEDPQTVVAPIIDSILDKNMAYRKSGRSAAHIPVGVFDWNLVFHWGFLSEKEKKLRKNFLEPVKTPTIAGGLFSINREYFTNIGTYDAGMDIWGGENIEMSFRVWLCGGRLLIAPCSRVGHIFRKTSPYNSLPGQNVFQKNSMRAAEVWLDDYKQYYYERFNYRLVDFGDVSERLALKKRLKCHPFEWYLNNIIPELYVPRDTTAGGEIINVNAGICLEITSKTVRGPVNTYTCHGRGGNQFWLLTIAHQIRRDDHCMRGNGKAVDVEPCANNNTAQHWLYREDNTLFHIQSETCMDLEDRTPVLATCSGSRSQRWMWKRRKQPTHVV